LLVLSVCLACPVQVQASQRTILVLGDSISAAYGMSLQQGWVALMAEQLHSHPGQYSVVNASISGETTAGGLRRLPDLLQQHNPGLVIIELGANDGLRGHPIGTLRNNLRQLVQLSSEAGAGVVLLPMEIPPNYGARYTSSFRDSFVKVAQETRSSLAPFIMHGVATDPDMMQADGIHPKVEAQTLMLENVLPTVLAALAN